MKGKSVLLLIVLLIGAVGIGGMIGSAAASVPALAWLSYSKTLGLSADKPAVIDLSVLRLVFGLQLKINIAQAICLIAAAIFYHRKR